MKLTIERGTLLKSLQSLNRVVEKRNTYPILANIMLRSSGNAIELRATDLDIEATDIIAAGVSEEGETTMPASALHDIVRKMPDGAEIHISTDGDIATVKSGRSRFSLATLRTDGFPELKSGTYSHSFSMKPADLATLLGRAQFAISTEETRYYLNGVFVHSIEGAEIRGVATDGHRLARIALPCPDGADGMPGIIIPRKTVAEILRLVDAAKEDVQIDLSDTKIRFRVGEFVLLSKLIEGSFPDYERVTPKNNDKIVTIDRSQLAKVADRVGTISSERGGKAVKFTVGEGDLSLKCTNPDSGEAEDSLPAKHDTDTQGFEIGFNVRYLLELLNNIEGDEVRFAFNDAGSPTLITGADDAAGTFVLMPMRV